MAKTIGGNLNTNDESVVTTVEINSVTATKLVNANPSRIFLNISLSSIEEGDTAIFIRLYPATDNDDKTGIPIGILTVGNNNIFKIDWEMNSNNIYTGEVSAITNIGTTIVNITEY